MRMSIAKRLSLPALLAAAAVSLASCGSSGAGLIPAANAGPLQSDFERVAQLAQEGEGSCGPTRRAIEKTESDFEALPSSVDAGLHSRLHTGIRNLRVRALEACRQPGLSTATTTATEATSSTSSTTSSTTTTETTTETTSETSSSELPTSTTPVESGPEGGVQAPSGEGTPEEESEEEPGGAVP